ncbi:MAG: hypothetical protein M1832_005657 [Thelocarpon impressellum]|nr:MAG: hypothetical protein M1832_005657 [Thelocarpon impressellum]
MTALALTANPDSPPDLTHSKSSKSSSFHSSQLDQDAILSDVSHFEEIGLGDDARDHDSGNDSDQLTVAAERVTLGKRPHQRVVSAVTRSSTAPVGPLRELTGLSKRPGVFATSGHGRTAENDMLSVRRGLTSPSTPSLTLSTIPGRLSRSPSPTLPGSCPISPLPFSQPAPRLRHNPSLAPTPRPHSRRSSWQPSRKSVQQLEEECHDSDEDVPDEAVIWNVPISPRPPRERSSSFASHRSSSSASPERKSPLSHSLASDSPTVVLRPGRRPVDQLQRIVSGSLPPSPTKHHASAQGMPRGASAGSFPLDSRQRRVSSCRTKSWTAALSELSDEARVLTEALEAHASDVDRAHEGKLQPGITVPHRPEKQDIKATVLELPPLRKGEVMVDPLPISKEKEAVLTRTRPSWLPPKSKKEEKKHLREYQRMMALSQEAERKKAAREKEALLHRDDNAINILRIWDQHVLPDWERVIREPRTRELWWRGVPPRSRGTVWQRAVGNELELSEQSYEVALRRAKEAERDASHHSACPDEQRQRHGQWFRALRRDAHATFPELHIFQAGGPLNDALVEVLMAYTMYRSDLGYIHGTHLIAALLLLNLPTAPAFLTLANLLNRPLPLAFLTADAGATERAYALTLRTFAYKFPALHDHLLQTIDLPPHAFLEPLFRTLLARALPLDTLARVWDVYVFEGDGFLVRAAIAALGRMESRLLGAGRDDALGVLGWSSGAPTWDVGSEEGFMSAVREAGKEERERRMGS